MVHRAVSHSRTEPSAEALARVVPARSNASAVTSSVCSPSTATGEPSAVRCTSTSLTSLTPVVAINDASAFRTMIVAWVVAKPAVSASVAVSRIETLVSSNVAILRPSADSVASTSSPGTADTSLRSGTLHSCTVFFSTSTAASSLPSALIDTVRYQPSPSASTAICLRSGTLQSRNEPSRPPLTATWPSALIATDVTAPWCPDIRPR